MKKWLCAAVLSIAVLAAGCGESKTQELTLGDVTYNIPEKWINEQYQEKEIDGMLIISYFPQKADENGTPVAISIGYNKAENEPMIDAESEKKHTANMADMLRGMDNTYDVKYEQLRVGDVEGYEISYVIGTDTRIVVKSFQFETQHGYNGIEYMVREDEKEKYDKEYDKLLETITCETPVNIIGE